MPFIAYLTKYVKKKYADNVKLSVRNFSSTPHFTLSFVDLQTLEETDPSVVQGSLCLLVRFMNWDFTVFKGRTKATCIHLEFEVS